jgi:hypothetical protein
MSHTMSKFLLGWKRLLIFPLLARMAGAGFGVQAAPPSDCIPSPSGVVSWWRAEGNANDQVGTNDGVLVGSASYAAGEVGFAFSFQGSVDAVTVGSGTSLQLQNFTIEGWVARANGSLVSFDPQGDGLIFSGGISGYGFGLHQDGSMFLSYVGYDEVASPAGITDTAFHHLAVTKSGSSVVFYLDGAVASSATYGSVFSSTNQLAIGARVDELGNVNNGFYGFIDELAVYNRSLPAWEIQAIYQNGSTGKCLAPATTPFIYTQPTNQTTVLGHNASFSVLADGPSPLHYQWDLNGTNIAAATNISLSLTNVQSNQAGSYTLVLSNNLGAVTSSIAILTITTPTCSVPPSGLLSWWRADGNGGDWAGTNQGTLAGGVTYGPGEVGQGFLIPGSLAGVRTGFATNLQIQVFTIEAWVQRSSTSRVSFDSQGDGIFFGYGIGGYGLGILSSGLLYLSDIGYSSVQNSVAITDTNFHHVAVSADGANVVFYVDGVPSSPIGYSPGYTFSTASAVGARGDTLGNSFYGTIDELAIYNRALSAGEIGTIYNSEYAGKCPGSHPPFVVVPPANQTNYAGSTVALTVQADGSPPLSFQWSFLGTNVNQGTGSTLYITTAIRFRTTVSLGSG